MVIRGSLNWQSVMYSRKKTRGHSLDSLGWINKEISESEDADGEYIREQCLLAALNQASLAMQEVSCPEDIFNIVGGVFKELGFSYVVFLTGGDESRLFPRYFNYEPEMVGAAEKLVGININDFGITIDDKSVFREIIRGKRTVFVDDPEQVVRKILPEFAKSLSGQMVNMLQVPRFSVTAPFIVGKRVIGAISVQSDDLTEKDIPMITAFACQMVLVWYKSSHIQELERELVELKESEGALRQSEEKFRKIFENANDGIIYLDNSGTVIEINEKLLETLGYEQMEIVGKKFSEIDFLKPVHMSTIMHYFQKYMEKGETYSFTEIEAVHKDGHTIYFEANASRLQQKQSESDGLLIIVRDITEKKQVDKVLKENEARFRNIVENATDVIYTHDLEGNIKSINPVVTQVYGYTIEEALQLNIAEIVVPGYLPLARQMILEKLSGISIGPYELLTFHKNGESLWVEVNTRLLEHDGKPVGVQGIARDITERKRAEEQTMQLNLELAALSAIAQTVSQSLDIEETLNAALDKTLEILNIENAGILLMNEDRGRLILRSYRGISDHLAESFSPIKVGRGNLGYVAQSGEPLFLESLLNTGDSMHENMEIITSEYQLESAMLLPLKARGNVLGVMFAATRDKRIFTPEERSLLTTISHQISTAIENIQLLEATSQAMAMEKTDRLRSAFLASISHEIRTPLTSIKGIASTLVQPDVEWDANIQKEFLETINKESDRLVHIVTDVLDMSKLETGAMKLCRDWVSFERIINELSVVLSNITLEHAVELNLADDLPVIFVDQVRIGQVITNLIENAVAHSPCNSAITIEASVSEDSLVVRVTDNGEGIPIEEIERIFDIFYRIEDNTKRRLSGSGLGLAICRGIVEVHGGMIWAESDGPGKGATVCFTIPLQVKEHGILKFE